MTAMTSAIGNDAELTVRTPSGRYSILLGHGLLYQVGKLAAERGLGRKVVIATDENVASLYGARSASALEVGGFQPHIVVMPVGEAHKHWGSVSLFVEGFLKAELDRSGWVMALGGGVVGDTAGFAASIYMRGVPLVQVPTTLLAMADSSIGGKVGVDHPAGKNLLGAFKQPELVVADLDALNTLSPLQVSYGMAEIIKAGVIGDPTVFELIERSDPQHLDYQTALLRAIDVKRKIVEADPYEAGSRALLNLGHTFGHAFESCTDYTRPHGVAVAQGMVVAFHLAHKLGMCSASDVERLELVLAKWRLPSKWGELDLAYEDAPERIYEAMLLDKKRRDGRIRLVLPEGIGKVAVVDGVAKEVIVQTLTELR
jgi:3-dehydroquinate synthase